MTRRKKKKISIRHRRLVDAYFECGMNETEAARRLGYVMPNKYASRLFDRPEVVAEIERIQNRMSKKAEITRERLLNEYAKIGFSNLGDLIEVDANGDGWIDLSTLSSEQRAAISEFTVEEYKEGRGDDARDVKKTKIKFSDKKGSLDSIARILGLFNDKLKVEGSISLVERLQRGRKQVKRDDPDNS